MQAMFLFLAFVYPCGDGCPCGCQFTGVCTCGQVSHEEELTIVDKLPDGIPSTPPISLKSLLNRVSTFEDYCTAADMAKADRRPLYVIVNCDRSMDSFPSNCLIMKMDEFDGIKRGVVVGVWNNGTFYRADLPANATTADMAKAARYLETYRPPMQRQQSMAMRSSRGSC